MSGQLSTSSHLETLNRSWDFSNSTQQNKYLLLMPSKAFTLNNSEAQDRSTVSLKLRVLNGKVQALHTKLIRELLPRLCSHLPERQLNRKALPLTWTKLQENTDRF